jgi:hypothetical protein
MRPDTKLALPFAFVGAAPFVMVGQPIEALLGALSMGLAGGFMHGKVSWRGLGCATTVLGGIAGIFAGSFAGGVLLGLLAMFPLRLVAWAAEGGSARRGSVLDDIDVRQVWGVATVLVTVVPMPLFALNLKLPGLLVMMLAGVVVLVSVAVADVRDFRKLGRLALEAKQAQAAPLHPVQRAVPVTDVGIGELQHEMRTPGAPYRGSDDLLSVIRGDAAAARLRLIERLIMDVGLIMLLTAIAFDVSRRNL